MRPRPSIRRRVVVATLALGGVALAAAVLTGQSAHPRARDLHATDGIIRGVNWDAGRRPVEDDDFHAVVGAGIEWIGLVPYGFQRDPRAPAIRKPWEGRVYWSESDEGLRHTARLARRHGLRVMLKPQIWVGRRSGWVGDIAMTSEADWAAWFREYGDYLLHFARLGAELEAEILVIGTELSGTVHRDADWRRLIARVREVFPGELTYGANWNESWRAVPFWDALDQIGVSAYFPLSTPEAPVDSEAFARDLRDAWSGHRDALVELSRRVDRPVLFTEAGYRSMRGTLEEPWQWRTDGEVDLAVQAAGYDALLATFWPQPWFRGVFFWNWHPHRDGGPDDTGYSPRNKPAEEVMGRWFGSPARRAGG